MSLRYISSVFYSLYLLLEIKVACVVDTVCPLGSKNDLVVAFLFHDDITSPLLRCAFLTCMTFAPHCRLLICFQEQRKQPSRVRPAHPRAYLFTRSNQESVRVKRRAAIAAKTCGLGFRDRLRKDKITKG